ncbi:MAG: FAA hydrolase family protein [Flavobacteriaceae bacterium]|nr:FAA hydrolase family protein [Flavobacteriaceae bacterium]PHX83871.1 MAG: 2-hydroxyhepta-2,4-diene-1,7-dioate isomerase [Flavobacteriales bacterium]
MKIVCVGRNYKAHALELGNSLPEEPVIFCKPDSALLPPRNPFVVPPWTQDVHHEIEWVLRVGKVGKFIEPRFAYSYFDAMTVGLDFTARDLQTELKKKGLPWERAKGFDGSAVLGTWSPMPDEPMDHQIRLEKNGELVQSGNTRDFLTPLEDLIAFISTYFTLKKGDIIFTGTPAGVGPVKPGDSLEGFLNDDSRLRLNIR